MKAKFILLFAVSLTPMVLCAQNDYWFQKGVNAANPNEKIEYFTKSIEKELANAATYFKRGLVKNDLQDFQGAIADYSKVIELDLKDTDTYYNCGKAKFLIQDYKGALADFDKTIEIDLNNFDAILFHSIVNADLQDNNSDGVVIKTTYGIPETSVMGTGCILKGGYVITCAHIIRSNKNIKEILISTIDSEYYCNQLYYIDRFVDLALLRVDNLPKDIGFELHDYEDGKITNSVIEAEILKMEIIGNPMTFKKEPIIISKFEDDSSYAFLNSILLSGYNTIYEVKPGNSGSPIIFDNKIIGMVFGGIPFCKIPYLNGAIISTEYLTYIIKHIEDFKPFSINNIPEKTQIYSLSGTVIGNSNLIETEKSKLTGNVDLSYDSSSVHFSIKENLLNGLLKIQIGNIPFIEINFNDGEKNGEIKIFSLLNYLRIKGEFENDIAIGDWKIYNGYNEQIASVPYDQLNLYHLYEDLVRATSTEYILKYKKDGMNFSPSKFITYFVDDLRIKLENEKLSNNFEVIFKLPSCLELENLDRLANSALEYSKL